MYYLIINLSFIYLFFLILYSINNKWNVIFYLNLYQTNLSAVDLQTQSSSSGQQRDSEGGCMCWKYLSNADLLLIPYFMIII